MAVLREVGVWRQQNPTVVCCMLSGFHVPHPLPHEAKKSFKSFLRKNTFLGLQKLATGPARNRTPGRALKGTVTNLWFSPPGVRRESPGQPLGRTGHRALEVWWCFRVGEPLDARHGCTSSPRAPGDARRNVGLREVGKASLPVA